MIVCGPPGDTFNQTFGLNVGGQNVTVNAYQRGNSIAQHVYMDVLVDGSPIIQGVICQNLNRIVRDAYLGFVGDFVWFDTAGSSDPTSPGLGSRFLLLYLSPSDLTALGFTLEAAGV